MPTGFLLQWARAAMNRIVFKRNERERMTESNRLDESWRMQADASAQGFDWDSIDGVLDKVNEEIAEIREALHRDDVRHACEELGDLFFAAVNLARFLEVHPSDALHGANEKFQRRFFSVTAIAEARNIDLRKSSLSELDAIWDEVKRAESDAKK